MVSAKIPPWPSYPSIDDEIDELYDDETLQAQIPQSAEKTFSHLSGIHLLPHPGGFKAASIPIDKDYNVLNSFKSHANLGNEEWKAFGKLKDKHKIIKVSARLNGSSSRTNIIDYSALDKISSRLTSLPVSLYPPPPPTFTAAAEFPPYLRSIIKPPNFLDRKNSTRYPLEDKATWNNNLMEEGDEVRANKIVWCGFKNSGGEKKQGGTLAVYKKKKSSREVVSIVNGYRLKNAQHKKPVSIKVAIRLNGRLLVAPPPPPSTTDNGAFNAMVMVNPEAGIESASEALRKYGETYKDDPGFLRYEGSCMVPPILHGLPLDDGPVKTVCLKAGNLLPVDLNVRTKREEGETRTPLTCEVCDISEEADASLDGKVYQCAFCGLQAHLDCCYDQGLVSGVGKNKFWLCSVCDFSKSKRDHATSVQPPITATNPAPDPDPALTTDATTPAPIITSTTPTQLSSSSGSENNSEGVKRAVRATRLLQADGDSDNKVIVPPPDWSRPSHSCILCYHTGGAMSPYSEPGQTWQHGQMWVHEVCRIWSMHKKRVASNPDVEKCALCGVVEGQGSGSRVDDVMLRRLARCAHKDCSVTFHPMCAKIGSAQMKARMMKRLEGEEANMPARRMAPKLKKKKKKKAIVKTEFEEKVPTQDPKPPKKDTFENDENVVYEQQIRNMLGGMSEFELREARKKASRNHRERRIRREAAVASGKDYTPKLWTQALPNVPDEVLVAIQFHRGGGMTFPAKVVLENPGKYKRGKSLTIDSDYSNQPPQPQKKRDDKPPPQMSLGGDVEPEYNFELEKDGYDDDEWAKVRRDDLMKCCEWTLRVARANFSGPHEAEESSFPLVFCGLHNPDRDEGLKGWPAGGAPEGGHCFAYPTRTPPPEANAAVDKWAELFARNQSIKEKRRKERAKEAYVAKKDSTDTKDTKDTTKVKKRKKIDSPAEEKTNFPATSNYFPQKKAKKGEEGWDSGEEELALELEILREAQLQEEARKEMKTKRRGGGATNRGGTTAVPRRAATPNLVPQINPELNEETVVVLKSLLAVNTNASGGSAIFKAGMSSLEDTLVGLNPEFESKVLDEVGRIKKIFKANSSGAAKRKLRAILYSEC
ncbi:hypothetical protein TrVE_jg12627 [Triparma verrucosa]|uniref:PHD-type domain-containing protein n=1 Tax=Triparma verrucosa TaxID=1606542 RepID=A0A9W7FBJ4_9STRA|nr:hypothetical protein TrVE_jg12627 [Triparma verrucosa]